MSTLSNTIRGLAIKRAGQADETPSPDAGSTNGRPANQMDNPYLTARRAWNDHVGSVVASRQIWQVVALLSLLITQVK